MEKKKTISQRINARLAEAPGEVFKDGKWRFWFVLVFGLGLGSAIVTAMIYAWSAGTMAVAVGVLVFWTCIGTLYYSDSEDSRLARGVSLLDSVSLVFVVAHFCFVMWAYTHLLTLREADAKYELRAVAFNERADKVSGDNVKIAEAVVSAAKETTKAEKLRNDTAYQTRKAAEAGAQIRAPRSTVAGLSTSLSTAAVELEKPVKPEVSATAFLVKWDAWIRAANFGELILAAITLIYIRNRSAVFNAKNAATALQSAGMGIPATVAPLRRATDARIATPVATVAVSQRSALNALRGHLRAIAFHHPGRWFKADLIDGGVAIRMCERVKGREVDIAKTRQSEKILAAVNRPDFQERLRAELIACGFPIGGER